MRSKPKPNVKKDELVKDEVLDVAVSLLKARDVLGGLKPAAGAKP